ncbi:NAD-dependent epimerase/dehydratase family protein [Streptosporangium sp. NBC_01469]|uniref:NAD-dependent epimerase/dehydratase family protein n=1 Tax=Streptosporangium sp. NBC_01469 TaxID=2903898 RepID=UPI002E2CD01F|nr:NAD-dependent epimerase/dehydratase family protein [Streptosporangium sp. NBC_01469]
MDPCSSPLSRAAFPGALSLARRRVVVTGAAGFIGSHLCERLTQLDAQVVGVDSLITGRLDNLTELMRSPAFELITCDVTAPFDVTGPVDAVLHLASPASPRDYLRLPLLTLMTGALGTLQALQLARAKQSRFVLASTSEVYGDPLEHPQQESYLGNVNPIGPRSVYDEAKRYAEALTASFRRDSGTDTAIARIFNTYGPRMRPDDGRAVPAFIAQAHAGRPLTVAGDGSQTRSLCYVADTVDGLLALAASEHSGPVNIGSPEEITMLELAHHIRRLCGSASPIGFVDLPADDPRRRCPDITLARDLLGWSPRVGLADGLARTVRWAAGPDASVPTVALSAAARS